MQANFSCRVNMVTIFDNVFVVDKTVGDTISDTFNVRLAASHPSESRFFQVKRNRNIAFIIARVDG